MTVLLRKPLLLTIAVLAACGSGCALREVGQTLFTNKPVELGNHHYDGSLLPAIPKPKDVVQLDVTFVERPVGDPLLAGELWDEIDQVSAVAPEARSLLRRNGVRAGIASAVPSRAVQALLGISTDIPDQRNRIAHHTAPVPSGGSIQIPCTVEPYSQCILHVVGRDAAETKTYENARCVLRVTAHRLQEGWVQLEFQPEIHHDDRRVRPTATESRQGLNWRLQESQQVEPLYDQRFTLKLNMGEMAVLAAEDVPQSVGRLFFIGDDPEAKTQRVLVIRLADMVTANPVRVQRFGEW